MNSRRGHTDFTAIHQNEKDRDLAAWSMSASENTMAEDLPPISNRTSFELDLAAASWINLPVLVDPVSVSLRIRICL